MVSILLLFHDGMAGPMLSHLCKETEIENYWQYRGENTTAGTTEQTSCGWFINAYRATRTKPFPVGYFWHRGVQAMQVIGRGAGVTTKELPTVLADPTELHVVIFFLTHVIFLFLLLLLRLPLDAFLLLEPQKGRVELILLGFFYLPLLIFFIIFRPWISESVDSDPTVTVRGCYCIENPIETAASIKADSMA